MLEYEDIIRDPIHNYIYITKLEERVINSPFFQRLRLLKQTPGASWVYPSANHTRFEHSVGVMHLGGRLAEKLLYQDDRLKEELKEEEKRKTIQKVRLTGLLHDIGHGPFSHVFEEFLNNLNQRLNHEDLGAIIIEKKVAPLILQNASEIQYDENDVNEIVGWLSELEYGIGSVITESINADALDYLVRDAYNTGAVEYGWIDFNRIIENTNIVRLSDREKEDLDNVGTIVLRENSERKKFDNVILVIDERAIIAVESFFVSRMEMYKAVYYHRTVRAIENGIVESMEEIADEVPGLRMFKDLSKVEDLYGKGETGETKLDDYICLNDYLLLGKILERNCEAFKNILQRKHKRMVLEKTEEVSSDEIAEYTRCLARRKSLEEKITEELSKEKVDVDITLDVPFPLLAIKVGRLFIKYREGGLDKISTITNYGKLSEKRTAAILRVMIEHDMLRMIEQKIFADTEDEAILEKAGEIARRVLGGGGVSPPHI